MKKQLFSSYLPGDMCFTMFDDVPIWQDEDSSAFELLGKQTILIILEGSVMMWKVFSSEFGVGFVSKINVEF